MLIRQLGGNRSFATSTAPKFAPTTVDAAHADNSLSSRLVGLFLYFQEVHIAYLSFGWHIYLCNNQCYKCYQPLYILDS